MKIEYTFHPTKKCPIGVFENKKFFWGYHVYILLFWCEISCPGYVISRRYKGTNDEGGKQYEKRQELRKSNHLWQALQVVLQDVRKVTVVIGFAFAYVFMKAWDAEWDQRMKAQEEYMQKLYEQRIENGEHPLDAYKAIYGDSQS